MNKIIVAALFMIVIIFALRLFLGGPEDSWICQNGQWIKHGNPSAPSPTSQCIIK
jgi:hypothetical protein